MGFFKLSKQNKVSNQVYTDEELHLKAAGVFYATSHLSDRILKNILEEVEELKNIDQIESNKAFFIISYVFLYHTLKFFKDNIIEDENIYLEFEKQLYKIFDKYQHIKILPYINDLEEYMSGDDSKEMQYVGSRICKVLNKEESPLMLYIGIPYGAFLAVEETYMSLKVAWDLPYKELQEILKNIEKQS